MAAEEYVLHHPPTSFTNNPERLERRVMSCQPRNQTNDCRGLAPLSLWGLRGLSISPPAPRGSQADPMSENENEWENYQPRLYLLLRMNSTPWRSDDTGSQQSMNMDKCVRVYVLGGRALRLGRLTNGGVL